MQSCMSFVKFTKNKIFHIFKIILNDNIFLRSWMPAGRWVPHSPSDLIAAAQPALPGCPKGIRALLPLMRTRALTLRALMHLVVGSRELWKAPPPGKMLVLMLISLESPFTGPWACWDLPYMLRMLRSASYPSPPNQRWRIVFFYLIY